tara:strand:+ start:213051 stop:213581 length:531 start_codon:yes stop_codon:yes gene_type:complete
MAKLTIEIPDELLEELEDITEQLKISTSETVMLALSFIMQQDTLDNAIEGIARVDDQDENEVISFPEIKEELDIDINFHARAMEELDALDEEEQIELIGHLIERLSQDDEELDEDVDLVLREDDDASIILSCFDFGDIIYKLSEDITVYHIAMLEPEEDEDFDELIEDLEELSEDD